MGSAKENEQPDEAASALKAVFGILEGTKVRAQIAEKALGAPIGNELRKLGLDICHLINREIGPLDLGDLPASSIKALLHIAATKRVLTRNLEKAEQMLVRDFVAFNTATFVASPTLEAVYDIANSWWAIPHPSTQMPLALVNQSSNGISLAIPSIRANDLTPELTTDDILGELERYYSERLSDGLPLERY